MGLEESLSRLSENVDLILECEYPPSLRSLVDALKCCDKLALEIWSEFQQDKIKPLSFVLIQGLEFDPYAIDCIQVLGSVTSFRDTFVNLNPQIIDTIARAAVSSEKGFERHCDVLASLLSPKYEHRNPLPACITLYVSMLLQFMNKDSVRSLQILNVLLFNNADILFQCLSHNQQYALHASLAEQLSSKDTNILLHSLSCLASLTAGTHAVDAKVKISDSASLFCAEKGLKVLRLITSAVNNCLSDHSTNTESTVRYTEIELATNIVRAIDRSTLEEWTQNKKEGCPMLRKTLDKIDCQMNDLAILRATAFVGALSEGCKLDLRGLKETASRIIARTTEHLVRSNVSLTLLGASANIIGYCNSETLLGLLCQLLSSSSYIAELRDFSWQNAIPLKAYLLVCDCFLKIQELDDGDALAVSLSLSFNEALTIPTTTKQLENLLNVMRSGDLSTDLERRADEFGRKLCLLVLQAQICDRTERSFSLNRKLCRRLVTRLSHRLITTASPHYKISKKVTRRTLFEESNAADSTKTSIEWREKLLDDLEQDARHQHVSIVARVNTICRDLEKRAETNEAPLQRAMRQIEELSETMASLEFQLSSAQAEVVRKVLACESANDEKSKLVGSVTELVSEIQDGHCRIAELEGQAAFNQERFEQMAIEVETMNRTSQDYSQMMRDRCETLEGEVQSAKAALANEEMETSRLSLILLENHKTLESQSQRMELLEEEADMKQRSVNVQMEQFSRQEFENLTRISSLDERNNYLQSQIENAAKNISTLQGQVSALEAGLLVSRAKEDSLIEMREAAEQKAQAQIAEIVSTKDIAMKALEDNLEMLKKGSDEALRSAAQEQASLRKTLSRLKTLHERRNLEFKRAQELSKKLTAIMSLDAPVLSGLAEQFSPDSPVSVSTPKQTAKRQRMKVFPTANPVNDLIEPTDGDRQVEPTFDYGDPESNLKTRHIPTDASVCGNRASLSRTEDSGILIELRAMGI